MTETIIIDSTTHKACAYIIDLEGRYLLQRRSSHMCDGSSNMLTLFGWWVDAGETVIQWLIRELQEELELDTTLCDVHYVWCHVSSTGVRFEIFEVQMNHPQHLVLHEWDEIVMITKAQLYDSEITSWFQKINQVYLSNMVW